MPKNLATNSRDQLVSAHQAPMPHHHEQRKILPDTDQLGRPGKIRFGDVSHWARATTHAVRPNCKRDNRTYSPTVTDLKNLAVVSAVKYPHRFEQTVVLPVESPRVLADSLADTIDRTYAVSDMMNIVLGLPYSLGELSDAALEYIALS